VGVVVLLVGDHTRRSPDINRPSNPIRAGRKRPRGTRLDLGDDPGSAPGDTPGSGTLARVSTDPKDRWLDLGAFIREQRGSARLSLRRLSELAGISNPYLSQIERGLRRPSAEILQQIAKALRISAETLYVQAGILEPPSGSPDLTRAIMADQSISEEQKQALVRIYLSFRRDHVEGRGEPSGTAPATVPADAAGPADRITIG
jgi:transcriptional regulator with XRE-family HTH domain